MRLDRPAAGRGSAITLVPLVDALLILLVFFMVTSSYLDLDMLPLAAPEAPGDRPAEGPAQTPIFLRLAADGAVVFRGTRLPPAALQVPLAEALAERPGGGVVVLPSPGAPVAALVATLEAAGAAGAGSVRLLQVEEGG